MSKSKSPNSIVLLIVLTTAIRCVLSLVLNLGNDEVYYFTYAVQPDWNHFDHPPLVGISIRLFTLNLHWINDFSMRLPAIVGAAINTWLIAKCAEHLGHSQTGLFAAILYNTSIYTGIIAGFFILPDSVQIVFWLAAIRCMLRLSDDKTGPERNQLLLMLGVWIGLAVMCKVHGIFLWIGFLGFVLCNRINWFKNPYLYASLTLTAILISPIVFWNIHNAFISWTFHSERVELTQNINPVSFFRTSLGQIAYQNPVNIVIFVLACAGIRKSRLGIAPLKIKLLLWVGIPIITSTVLVSLFRNTLPHWSGPGFIAFNLLGASYLSSSGTSLSKTAKNRLLTASASLLILILASGTLLITQYPGSLTTVEQPNTGAGDLTLDLNGWEQLREGFEKIRIEDVRLGHMQKDSPIIVNKWFPGGHIYFYVAYPLKMDLIGVGDLADLHKFRWLNNLYPPLPPGSSAYYIAPSNNFTDPSTFYGDQFKKIEIAGTVLHDRNGKIARYWYIYRLRNAIRLMPATEE